VVFLGWGRLSEKNRGSGISRAKRKGPNNATTTDWGESCTDPGSSRRDHRGSAHAAQYPYLAIWVTIPCLAILSGVNHSSSALKKFYWWRWREFASKGTHSGVFNDHLDRLEAGNNVEAWEVSIV